MNADKPSRLDGSPQELQPSVSEQPPPSRLRVEPDASVQQRFEDAMTRSREAQARQGRLDVLTPSMLMGLSRQPAWEPALGGQSSRQDSSGSGEGPTERESGAQDSQRTGVIGLRHETGMTSGSRAWLDEALAGQALSAKGDATQEVGQMDDATQHKMPAPLAEAGATVTQAYGLVSGAFRTDWSSQAPERSALNQRLTTVIAGLYVGEGAHGGKQVRLDLKEDALPGVTVAIEEVGGRMQIDFTCSVEASRLRLNEAVPEVAPQVAGRLERDVLMRVQTDDDEDRRLLEVAASPQPPTG